MADTPDNTHDPPTTDNAPPPGDAGGASSEAPPGGATPTPTAAKKTEGRESPSSGPSGHLLPGGEGAGGPSDDSELLTTGQFAERVGVTSQTVRLWAEKGQIRVAREKKTARGIERWIRASEAERAKQNHGTPGRGGTRRGAGRKRKRRGGAQLPENAVQAGMLASEVRDRTAPPDPDGDDGGAPISLGDLLWMSTAELAVLAALHPIDERGLSRARLDLLKQLQEIRKKRLDLDVQEGRLVRAEGVEKAFGDVFRALGEALRSVPGDCAADLERIASPDGHELAELSDFLRGLGVDSGDAARAVALVRRPPDLHAACRTLVEHRLNAALTRFGEVAAKLAEQHG